MRDLVYLTLGFALSCGGKTYGLSMPWMFAMMGSSVLLCGIMAREQRIRRGAVAVLGCILGLVWFRGYDVRYLNLAANLDGQTRDTVIRVEDYSYETAYGMAFDGEVMLADQRYQVTVYLDSGEPLEPGMQVMGSFRFRFTAPGGREESRYHQGKGIFLLAYQKGEVSRISAAPANRDFPAILRQRIKIIIDTTFADGTAPFAKALLLGDTLDLSYETDTDFKISGIRHVVAVSGLHVSILFALISSLTLQNRWLTALVGFPVLAMFAAVAGFTPSVSRACLMSALMLLALLANREYDGPAALSFAVLVILMVNPLAITSVSFQLSVSSVAGIYLFCPGIHTWLMSCFGEVKGKGNLWMRWIASSVATTLSATTLTTPISAYYFGTVSLIGVVTNLLTLWVISFVFYGITAVCLLHLFWAGGASLLAKLISLPIRYVLLVAHWMAKFPLEAVYTESVYISAWLLFVYALLGIFLISKKRKPVLLSCCAVLGLCAALLASWLEPLLYDVQFSVLDVGQGQCLLLQTEGKTVMIDCGGDSDTRTADIAAEALLSRGIARLDVLVLTHLDRDHAGAAENLLSRVPTELLILPAVRSEIAYPPGTQVLYAQKDLQLALGSGEIRVFAPTFPGNSNEMSLCLLLDTKKCDILVTGDRSGFGERALLRNAAFPHVDVLMAGHHGSANSTCEELLDAVRPEIVCISLSADNSYGHPAPELLQRLQQFGCTVYRTDLHGTITIRR